MGCKSSKDATTGHGGGGGMMDDLDGGYDTYEKHVQAASILINNTENLDNSLHGQTKRQKLAWHREMDISNVYDIHKEIGKGSLGEVYSASKKAESRHQSYKNAISKGLIRSESAESLSKLMKQSKEESEREHAQKENKFNEHYGKRLYAVKTVNTTQMNDNEILEFINEIDILRDLDHPNIIQLFEVYRIKKRMWIVTEICTGGDLTSRLDSMCESDVAVITEQILRAVYYMHKRNVCHRDIKLENIMYSNTKPNSPIKLIDFGLSNKFTRGEEMRKACGTIYAAAPEILFGMGYTEQADMWSIGVCTFIMLSKQYPFLKEIDELIDDEKKENLKEAKYKLKEKYWSDRSQQSKIFIGQLLNKHPHLRARDVDALHYVQDEWLPKLEFFESCHFVDDDGSSNMEIEFIDVENNNDGNDSNNNTLDNSMISLPNGNGDFNTGTDAMYATATSDNSELIEHNVNGIGCIEATGLDASLWTIETVGTLHRTSHSTIRTSVGDATSIRTSGIDMTPHDNTNNGGSATVVIDGMPPLPPTIDDNSNDDKNSSNNTPKLLGSKNSAEGSASDYQLDFNKNSIDSNDMDESWRQTSDSSAAASPSSPPLPSAAHDEKNRSISFSGDMIQTPSRASPPSPKRFGSSSTDPKRRTMSEGAISNGIYNNNNNNNNNRRGKPSTYKRTKSGGREPVASIRRRSRMSTVMINGLKKFLQYGELKKTILMTMAYTMDKSSLLELQELFESLDSTGDGILSYNELKNALTVWLHEEEEEDDKKNEDKSENRSTILSEEMIQQLFDGIDLDKSGQIHYNEFLAAILESQGLITMENVADAFERIDSTSKGYISRTDLEELLGNEYDEKVVNEMINEADYKKNGRIDYDEFIRFMFENSSTGKLHLGSLTLDKDLNVISTTIDDDDDDDGVDDKDDDNNNHQISNNNNNNR